MARREDSQTHQVFLPRRSGASLLPLQAPLRRRRYIASFAESCALCAAKLRLLGLPANMTLGVWHGYFWSWDVTAFLEGGAVGHPWSGGPQ